MKTKIKIIISIILSIPKSFLINIRIFGIIKGIKMPILVSNNIKVRKIYKKSIIIDSPKIKFGIIKIGFGGSSIINDTKGILYLNKKGKLIFKRNG